MKLSINSTTVKFFAIAVGICLLGCGANSVSREQLENVKAGDVLVYRYRKSDGKTWFYADKITRVEENKIVYNPSRNEGTAGNDERLSDFLTDKEMSIAKEELLKYETEQGDEKKVIIWIK